MKIQLDWVVWKGTGLGRIRSAHLLIPGTTTTACGISMFAYAGAQSIGSYGETERPDYQCCSLCIADRKKIADQIRLQQWNNAAHAPQDAPTGQSTPEHHTEAQNGAQRA